MSGPLDDTVNYPRRNYDSLGSRQPIWTQVSSDPEEEIRIKANRPQPPKVNDKPTFAVQHGISWGTAAIFIAGEMAGSGVLALPKALVDSGWVGPVVLIALCLTACYGGTRLGVCWNIMEERYPESYPKSARTRNPYATIAHRALGRWGSLLVSGCIQITLFGAGTVYLILAAELIHELLSPLLNISTCVWVVILAIFLLPATWLGSPKDFWGVAVGALLTTAFSCLLMTTQLVIDGLHHSEGSSRKRHTTVEGFLLAYGTMTFSFGGASTFPTIQNDMTERTRFPTSVAVGFGVIMLLYLPVALGGAIVYGQNVAPNVALSLGDSWLVDAANLLMASHLLLAFLIVINPVNQELEHILSVPHEFGKQRLWLRSGIILAMVFVAESIPQFGKILALVGGSTVTLLTFVLPPLCYMKLIDMEGPWPPSRTIPPHEKVLLYEMIALGILGGTASTYSALSAIFSPQLFSTPCYWRW